MEIPGRRSNYSLLPQFPEEQQSKFSYESHSGEKNRGKIDRGFDWDADHRLQQGGRLGNLFSSVGLQRQSSGSSFGESTFSGEYYVPTLSMAGNDLDLFGHMQEDGKGGGGELRMKVVEECSSSKSWAQQTEESYQLQLALALRLSSYATCADDPNFLDSVSDESETRSLSASAQAMSHRFWVNGCLSYVDKVPDGFYLIHGMDPYIWTVCTNLQENGRVPSIESLYSVDPRDDSSFEVVLIDKHSDPVLKELQNSVLSLFHSCITTKEVVDQLATVVCNHMGGAASTGEDSIVSLWRECSEILKDSLGSVVLPIGSLSVGLCRHRALLFKVLADTIDLPCRIAKGCKYCMRDDASSCLVRFGLERECVVDLIGKPGCLCEPDSLLNGPSTISISSPLHLSRFKFVEITENFRTLAKQYFLDCQSLNIVFDDAAAGTTIDQEDATDPLYPMHFDRKYTDRNNLVPVSSKNDEISPSLLPPSAAWPNAHDRAQLLKSSNPSQNIRNLTHLVKDPIPLKRIPPIGHRDLQPILVSSVPSKDTNTGPRFVEGSQLVPRNDIFLDVEDLDIPWSNLVLKERIGAGSFGTVHRADWHGSDVAVKILMEQNFYTDRFNEFLREVAIMKRLRHPNIVLFMGAVTQPPNLSIVTEYLSRGNLYKLLHRPCAREMMDERRRLNMAYDVAKGMNYLHRRNPPIVHRDLKSPNLLVDKKYTVKVCDFGLSRLKANTFLSAKSAAGTPEWMAPEVLRDEPSNEKSDVYSFGVILWELVTLQQPWSNLKAAQVVAAVGFEGKRLEIPREVNPHVAALIEACWANDSWKRPSFSTIMDSLKPLINPPTPQPVHADLLQLS
ncbi:hypothetical protein HHK36_016738 [Tetracentron sinense]|uniref:non-specific serine/threonine protein kinase n=1 Tax=Tetracentron sinense TaxID=13715 RepID=A0A834YXP7_TETSI|nr:hypothetical protein HHK36_016738 [Tetracentron sinense]